VAIQPMPMTVDDFDRFVALPENADRNFELIAGEIVEKMVSSQRSSLIGAYLAHVIAGHVYERDLGWVTGADGGYRVMGGKFIPVAAFISKTRQAVPSSEAYNPLIPDLAVEVISPTDKATDIRKKREAYIQAGVLLWEVYPDLPSIDVYTPGQPLRTLTLDDTLTGGDVLPDFKLSVRELFERFPVS
jgi:Uma2 family endonuclease